ncbi:MAG: hypothetical protein QXX61_00525 [Ignisphaera sp.]
MSNLKKLTPYILLTLLIASLTSTMIVALAQVPVQIVSVTTPAYPGEPVVVTMDIGLATTVTVRLCNDSVCSSVWAEQVFVPPTAGRYTITLTLPEKPAGLVNHNSTYRSGWVVVYTVFGGIAEQFYIAPKIKVSPMATTVVNPDGTSRTVTVEFLGYVPGDTVSTVVFAGPATYPATVTASIGTNGYGSASVNLLTITGQGIPRGIYRVYGVGTQTSDLKKAKNGTLEIRPQAIITPKEGNGRCDASVCDLTGVAITGYGFDPNVAIVKIELLNINFTNVKYVFTPLTGFATSAQGYFSLSNLKQYIAGGKGTNMTAGLYIPIVYEAPLPKTLTNTSTIDLKKVGSVVISETTILGALGTRASVRATSYVDGTLDYVVKASSMAFTKTEVLRINITYAGKKYQLAANIEGDKVRFALYNTTTIPYVTLFSDTASTAYNAGLGAYTANVSFNVVPTSYVLTAPPTPGAYKFWATFYNYTNQILLVLREWSFVVTKANLTIVYTNKDTGVTVSRFYVHPTNMSIVDTLVTISTLKFKDAGIEWSVNWKYDPSTKIATLTVEGKPLEGPSFEFRTTYYIVRPLLVLITPLPVLPGQTVTIAAYGYAPGAFWGHTPPGQDDNYLEVSWEKIVKLATVKLGKDGNRTFTITIPSDASFGVHYIWGVDKWNYEYTLAVIVGAKAYYTVVPVPPYAIPKEPIVSAGYDNKRVTVCPCPETIVGLSYCAKCVAYTGRCDYLGDELKVIISGASPGETFTIYFGGTPIRTVKANASTVEVSFIVPTVPEGDYVIVAVGTVSGSITITDYFNGTKFIPRPVMVRPKILLLDLSKYYLPVLVGPGFVRVLGTGFRPGVSFVGMLVNNTDAAFVLNTQVQRWSADERGVLINTYSKDIVPGLYIPALEPGAYEIKLLYVVGNEVKSTLPGSVFVINNLSTVATKSDIEALRSAILSRLDAMASAVEAARNAAVGAQEALAPLRTALENLINTRATELKTAIDSLSKFVSANMANKTDIKTLTTSMTTAIAAVTSAVNNVAVAVSDLRTVVATKSDVQALSEVLRKLDVLSSDLDEAIKTLQALQTALNALKALEPALGDVKNAVNDVKSSVESALGALSQARSEIEKLRTDVSGLRTDVTGVRTDISNVINAVNSVGATITDVRTGIDAVKSDLSAFKADMAGRLTHIDSKISTVDDGVGTLRTLVVVALVFAVIAAAAAIYATVAISRALAK